MHVMELNGNFLTNTRYIYTKVFLYDVRVKNRRKKIIIKSNCKLCLTLKMLCTIENCMFLCKFNHDGCIHS